MAIKAGSRYYSHVLHPPHGSHPELGQELPDVRDDGHFGRMYCKYCCEDQHTVSSYENIPIDAPAPIKERYRTETVQALCANCGAGLTDTEPSNGEENANSHS